MNLEYIPDGARETPLVRLYGFGLPEVAQLQAAISTLRNGDHANSIKIKNVCSCHLKDIDDFILSNIHDIGLWTNDEKVFLWQMAPPRWQIVEELLDPFKVESERDSVFFQWLCGPYAIEPVALGQLSMLITTSQKGEW